MTSIKISKPFRNNGAEEHFHKAFRAIALEYYKRFTMKTPRQTGRAAGNWQIGINEAPTGESNTLLPGAGTVSSKETGKLTKTTVVKFPTIIITNALPYILPLEYGSSQQAAQGMVRLTMTELKGWSAR